jgi:hypothetical protein
VGSDTRVYLGDKLLFSLFTASILPFMTFPLEASMLWKEYKHITLRKKSSGSRLEN